MDHLELVRGSGLKVNDSKTKICVFSRHDRAMTTLTINGEQISTKAQINVFRIIFDSKLQWPPQIANVLKKANKALNTITLIRKHFNSAELLQLMTSNFYSVQ